MSQVEPKSVAQVYLDLLERVLNANVPIGLESPTNLAGIRDAQYSPNAFGTAGPQIRLVRGGPCQSRWLTPKSTSQERMTFRDQSGDAIRDICLLAHEFGHHHSTFKSYEEIMAKGKDNPSVLTDKECAEIIREENFAWDYSRGLLTEIGFTAWERFEDIRAEGLQSYAVFHRGNTQ